MIEEEFDITKESLYCSRCGTKCEPLGHLMTTFLICPTHGEFTIAPVVVGREGKWYIHFDNEIDQSMWNTCRYVDEQGLSGRGTRTG